VTKALAPRAKDSEVGLQEAVPFSALFPHDC